MRVGRAANVSFILHGEFIISHDDEAQKVLNFVVQYQHICLIHVIMTCF